MSYRDILSRTERRRADGSPVWPIRVSERPSLAPVRTPLVVVEADELSGVRS